jgi:hypothetical protein
VTVALIVDAVELEAFARDIVHQLVAAGEDVVLVPTDGLKQFAPGWDADGFAEMVRNPAAPAHLDGTELSLTIGRVVVLASANWLASTGGSVESAEDAVRVLRSALERGVPILAVPGWEYGDEEVSALARSTAADMPSVEWLDPGTGAYGRAPAVTSSGEMFDAAWVEAWYWG